MNSLVHDITALIEQAYLGAYPGENSTAMLTGIMDSLTYPGQKFGDIATGVAMKIAAVLKTPPRDVAESLLENMPQSSLVASVSIAGAGFINFRLTPEAFNKVVDTQLGNTELVTPVGKGKKVAMDYSHPNIGKPMGVHHMLSTIIGDSIKRTLRAGSYEVIADNFIGDLGTQFGKLIWAVKQWGDTAAIEANPIAELQKLYVKFHIEADNDVALDDAGREEYLKLENGDKENRAWWHKIVDWSKAEIQPIYDALGVEFDYMNGESFYEDKMEAILQRGIGEGVFVESQGALVCLPDDSEQPPAILRKSDGATLYLTRDLARVAYWEQEWQPDIMLVVVDGAQRFSQQQLYEVAGKMHLTDADLTQVNFGRMRFADGSMSTRKGNILLLKDLIDEAERRALVLVQEKSHGLSEHEQHETAQKLAISSLKYNVLSQNRMSDITFDWSNILSFEGNSAPYLLYSLIRMRSLLTKAEGESSSKTNQQSYDWEEPIEREIALMLSQYDAVFTRATLEYKPSHLASYGYGLAQKYNNLYNNLPVLQADQAASQARIALTKSVEKTLEHAYGCLGLHVPDKM